MIQSNKKIVPISQQPTYQAAISKVVEVGQALASITARLQQCQADLDAMKNIEPQPLSVIDRALALARGGTLLENPPVETVTAEIKRLEEEQRVLKAGLMEADTAATMVMGNLSHQVGKQVKAEHQMAVKNILDRVNDLCSANKAEQELRFNLEKLGYSSCTLPAMSFSFVGELDDTNGSPAYYYEKEARNYVGR